MINNYKLFIRVLIKTRSDRKIFRNERVQKLTVQKGQYPYIDILFTLYMQYCKHNFFRIYISYVDRCNNFSYFILYSPPPKLPTLHQNKFILDPPMNNDQTCHALDSVLPT